MEWLCQAWTVRVGAKCGYRAKLGRGALSRAMLVPRIHWVYAAFLWKTRVRSGRNLWATDFSYGAKFGRLPARGLLRGSIRRRMTSWTVIRGHPKVRLRWIVWFPKSALSRAMLIAWVDRTYATLLKGRVRDHPSASCAILTGQVGVPLNGVVFISRSNCRRLGGLEEIEIVILTVDQGLCSGGRGHSRPARNVA